MKEDIYLQELRRIEKEIAERKKSNTLIFPLFSDLHVNGVDDASAQFFISFLSKICKIIHPDAVINLGDNLSMLGRDTHITNSQLLKEFSGLLDEIKREVNVPLFLINGNHDAIGTDFFKPEFWYNIINDKYDNGLSHRHKKHGYYYVDFEYAQTRLVFLSIPSDSCIDAENPTPVWSFGNEQLNWLSEVALKTKYNVLLFSHVPFFYRYRGDMVRMIEVWNGETTALSNVSELCGRIDDVEQAVNIIKENKNVIACFSGHTHEDSLWKPYEKHSEDKNILPCYQVVTKNPIPFPWEEEKGVFGISIDIVLFDYTDKKIDVIRFGDGKDRLSVYN